MIQRRHWRRRLRRRRLRRPRLVLFITTSSRSHQTRSSLRSLLSAAAADLPLKGWWFFLLLALDAGHAAAEPTAPARANATAARGGRR